jgi:seryl-tRNA synthetase
MLTVPNVPHESVPVGKDESGNVEIKKWGTPSKFDFPIKDHIELARSLDLIDFDRGAKVGGSRAYFLKNEAAQMEFAILFYTFQKLIKKGYTPLIAPSLVREFTLVGNGQFPWGREEVYHLEKDDEYLAGTAEVPVTAYFSDEVLTESDLPKKFVAFSPCFRREAGSYGKDTRGVYRLHQFNKIEQVIISNNDLNNSFTLHEELLANAEEVLQDLQLPYRVLLMCTGDMGEPQVKKYDVETWMPGRPTAESTLGSYGETMSNSVMGDFQARRLKIRYKTKDGKMAFCHTLNNTAIASPRILVAILENYQQKDGSVRIPDVLQSLMGKTEIRR